MHAEEIKPIYNRFGKTVGWITNDFIFDRAGHACAFVWNGAVVSYSGGHRGHFEQGFFRDWEGHAVAFVEGAAGGPLTPLTEPPPPLPALQLPTKRPPATAVPAAPTTTRFSLSWSREDWAQFLS
jgi:hypothetical protein